MKKQFIALGVASLLTAPSVGLLLAPSEASAEATWYGSFRARMHSQDGHTILRNGGSRWGVKGSNEVSEGLSAVYRMEVGLDLGKADNSDNDRLSFVGLSGGFGSITAGKVWSAFYNHVGVVTDTGVGSTNDAGVSYRSAHTVSYAASTGPVNFQVDLVMAPNLDGPKAGANNQETVANRTAWIKDNATKMGAVKSKSLDAAQFGLTLDTGFATVGLATHSQDKGDGSEKKIGSKKANGLGVSFPVSGFNIYASHTTIKDKTDGVGNAAGTTVKKKHNHAGVSGPVADTGLTFVANFADIDDGDSATKHGENPWNISIARSLGGGATVAAEYIDNDDNRKTNAKKNETVVQLKVDF